MLSEGQIIDLMNFFKQTIYKLKLTSKTINLLIIFACVFSFTHTVIKNVIPKAVFYYIVVTVAQIFPILSALTLSIHHVTLYVVDDFQSLTLCPTLCNPKDCSRPGFLVLHSLSESAQTHVC